MLKLLVGLAYVSVDEPQGFPSSTPPVVASTAKLAVLRLHDHSADSFFRALREHPVPVWEPTLREISN
jgi:hypothetical protein